MADSGVLNPLETIRESDGKIQAAVAGGIAGLITLIFQGVGEGVNAIVTLFVQPLFDLAGELGALIAAYIPNELLSAAVEISANSLAVFGPLAYPVGIIIMAIGLFVLSRLLAAPWSSNLVPFSTTDWPIVGTEEEEE